MALGRMNTLIEIVANEPTKDGEGFVTNGGVTLASVRAYREDRHGSEAWRNRAAFSTASVLFRFRRVPGLTVTTAMYIIYGEERYNIVNVEDVKGRGMYVEALAERVDRSE
jgi:head-tail adaptor